MPKRLALMGQTHAGRGPALPFIGLDVLWLQVAGTLCNIACRHCFITCGPKNDSHPLMSLEQVRASLDEAHRVGVKEYYFTGGEPFLHPEIMTMVQWALAQGPLTILTNALLFDDEKAAALGTLFRASPYSLDLRVSLDGTSPEENDPVRGKGTFAEIVAGAKMLVSAGINPVFTVTTVHATLEASEGRMAFVQALGELGFERPRVKFIPPFLIGREARRSSAYPEGAVLGEGDLMPDEERVLLCGASRTVTANGVYPCPILIEEHGARMGDRLPDTYVPARLGHPACVTCHVEGFSCRT